MIMLSANALALTIFIFELDEKSSTNFTYQALLDKCLGFPRLRTK